MKKYVFIIIICVVLGLVFRHPGVVKGLRLTYGSENNTLVYESLRRDSVLFHFSQKLPIFVSESRLICGLNSERALIVFIPEEACWSCFEPKLNDILDLRKKYLFELIFVTDINKIRTLKIILPDNLFLNRVVNYKDFDVKVKNYFPKKDIIWLVNDIRSDVSIPYIENKIMYPIDFLVKNFFESNKLII